MIRTCSFPDCNRPHSCKGLCAAHYRQRQKGLVLTALKVRETYVSPKCSVDGCDRPNKARGYCMTHYQQWAQKRTVRLVPKRARAASHPCQVTDCGRPQKSRGWCASHYQQWKRGVAPKPFNPRDRNGPETCTEPGCELPTKARGLCGLHYVRLRMHGYTHYTERSRDRKRCTAPGCTNWLWAKGLCHRHYIRINRLKDYGLTAEKYLQMLEDCAGLCQICGQSDRTLDPRNGVYRSLAIDHCHKTMTVRGLLCGHCNRALGLLNDDPELFMKAAKYLSRNQE